MPPPSNWSPSSVKFFLWCADDVANIAYLSRQNVLQKESDENSFTGFLFFKVQTFLINFVISFFCDPSAKFLLWFASFFPKYFSKNVVFCFPQKVKWLDYINFFSKKFSFQIVYSKEKKRRLHGQNYLYGLDKLSVWDYR